MRQFLILIVAVFVTWPVSAQVSLESFEDNTITGGPTGTVASVDVGFAGGVRVRLR